MELEFKETWQKDRGPIVRWISTKVLDVMHKMEQPFYPYAKMWEAVWEDYEDELHIPHNQMTLEEIDEECL